MIHYFKKRYRVFFWEWTASKHTFAGLEKAGDLQLPGLFVAALLVPAS